MTGPDRVTRLLALIGKPRTTGRYAGSPHTVYSAALEAGYTRSNVSAAYQSVARRELRKLQAKQGGVRNE